MLFDDKPRSRTAPKKPGESDYAFYDETNWPALDTYRQLLNGWLLELPESERNDLIIRFRKSNSLEYQAALAELVMHAALVRKGYKVALHPQLGHTSRRPDFLVQSKDETPIAYIEVTTFGPSHKEVAKSNREADIYNAIDSAKLPPGFRFSYDVVSYGTQTPSVTKLRSKVEAWAAANATDDADAPPERLFKAADWEIELKLFGGYKKDVPVTRAIGGAMGDVRHVMADREIRDALQEKGSRYGKLNAPYLVVVADCKGELQGGEDNAEALIDAMCGTYVQWMRTNGEQGEGRKSNGYWWKRGKPCHQNVSGVLLLPKPNLWHLREDRWQPLLIHHFSPDYALPDDFLPVRSYRHDKDKDLFVRSEGGPLADLLGLPAVWPPAGT